MESKQDAENNSSGQMFLTPIKNNQHFIQTKSTTGNLNSKDQTETLSFEKLLSRNSLAINYCSTNLNELLGSDVKFKSPGELLHLTQSRTPLREQKCSIFDVDHFCDSEVKVNMNHFELSLRRNDQLQSRNFPLREDGLFELGPCQTLSFDKYDYPSHQAYPLPAGGFSVDSRPDRRWKQGEDSDWQNSDLNCPTDDYRKRKRKNNMQLKILKNEFSKGDIWNKEKIYHVSQITGLSESQVYKWCWDQKKKVEDQENQKSNQNNLKSAFNLELKKKLGFLDLLEDDKENKGLKANPKLRIALAQAEMQRANREAAKEEKNNLSKRVPERETCTEAEKINRRPFGQINDHRV